MGTTLHSTGPTRCDPRAFDPGVEIGDQAETAGSEAAGCLFGQDFAELPKHMLLIG